MVKKGFIIAILLFALILVGTECGDSSSRKKKDKEETEWGYDKDGNRILLNEPELECWPLGSGIGESGQTEEEVMTIFGVEAVEKCKSLECETPEGMEWMTVVDYFEDKMEGLGWTKSGGQNIYFSDWQHFTIWYQGETKEKSQHYRLEYCDIIPEKDL